jgi:hypothetical protein
MHFSQFVSSITTCREHDRRGVCLRKQVSVVHVNINRNGYRGARTLRNRTNCHHRLVSLRTRARRPGPRRNVFHSPPPPAIIGVDFQTGLILPYNRTSFVLICTYRCEYFHRFFHDYYYYYFRSSNTPLTRPKSPLHTVAAAMVNGTKHRVS